MIGALLAASFDAVVTVAPHLHRTRNLRDVFGGKPAIAVDPAPLIAAALRDDGAISDRILLGPDEESAPALRTLAAASGLEFAVATKRRLGDRDVALDPPAHIAWTGRHVVIVDDISSTGGTLMKAAQAVLAAGAASVEAIVCHVPAPWISTSWRRRAFAACAAPTASRMRRMRLHWRRCWPMPCGN